MDEKKIAPVSVGRFTVDVNRMLKELPVTAAPSVVSAERPGMTAAEALLDRSKAAQGVIDIGVVFDISASTADSLSAEEDEGVMSKYAAQTIALANLIQQMQENEKTKLYGRLSLVLFSDKVYKICSSIPVGMISPEGLKQELLRLEPFGVTALGDAVYTLLSDLQEMKKADIQQGVRRIAQPIAVVITDGQPVTVDGRSVEEHMGPAVALADKLLREKKVTLFTVGVDSAGSEDFPWLERLMEHDWREAGTKKVVSSVDGLVDSFSYIGRTIIADSAGAVNTIKSARAAELKKRYAALAGR